MTTVTDPAVVAASGDTTRLPLPVVRATLTLVDRARQLEGLCQQVGVVTLPELPPGPPRTIADAVCGVLGLPVRFDGGTDASYAMHTLGVEIGKALADPALAGLPQALVPAVTLAARRRRDDEDRLLRRRQLERPDGTVLEVVEAGPTSGPAVVLASACGMSHRLAAPWMRVLAGTVRCITVETRGTNGPLGDYSDFDGRGVDVPDQVGDLVAVAERDAGPGTHLMGICGGAVNAMVAAAQRPDLFASLSLWHGDFDLGAESAKTEHQQNLRALLDMAGESRDSAAEIRQVLAGTPLTGVPEGLAPIVVRPYVDDELFHRYARLTAATMHWDSRETVARVQQPTLVVTSADDTTAHPDGSHVVAGRIADAHLQVSDHGTHLDAFAASPAQQELLAAFLFQVEARA